MLTTGFRETPAQKNTRRAMMSRDEAEQCCQRKLKIWTRWTVYRHSLFLNYCYFKLWKLPRPWLARILEHHGCYSLVARDATPGCTYIPIVHTKHTHHFAGSLQHRSMHPGCSAMKPEPTLPILTVLVIAYSHPASISSSTAISHHWPADWPSFHISNHLESTIMSYHESWSTTIYHHLTII